MRSAARIDAKFSCRSSTPCAASGVQTWASAGRCAARGPRRSARSADLPRGVPRRALAIGSVRSACRSRCAAPLVSTTSSLRHPRLAAPRTRKNVSVWPSKSGESANRWVRVQIAGPSATSRMPVSSRSSRLIADSSDSPGSTPPPGAAQSDPSGKSKRTRRMHDAWSITTARTPTLIRLVTGGS